MATNACPTRHAATGFFSACVALAHGLPWNLWLVNTDGTSARELAEVESDDGSVAWSPDGSALLVYGGSGAFVVDAATGDYQLLSYLTGYGSIAWLSDQDGGLSEDEARQRRRLHQWAARLRTPVPGVTLG